MRTRVYSPAHLNLLVDQHCYGLTLREDGAMQDAEGNVVRQASERIRHDLRAGTWVCVDALREKGIDVEIVYDMDNVIEI